MSKKTPRLAALMFVYLIFCESAIAESLEVDKYETRIYSLPVIDLPYNKGAYPSMHQSMQMSVDYFLLSHNIMLDALIDDGAVGQSSGFKLLPIVLFDFASEYLPLGTSWLHEEWHRAILGRRGIDSHNGVYNFASMESISVDRVKDADLINLKQNHPAEMVRLHSAGFEAQYEQNTEFEKHTFFYGHHPLIGTVVTLNYLGNIMYMDACTSSDTDKWTDIANQQEGADVSIRDFTGFDCTAWAYDLFRPTEPYTTRGTHPSGVGVDRYIKYSDLTAEEHRYLEKQRNLSFLNLVDPFLFGKDKFSHGNWFWNAALRHELTPFGYTVAGNLFLQERDGVDIFGTAHFYSNDTGTYPGVDVSVLRYPTSLYGKPVHVTPRVAAWMQPENLLFRDPTAKPGGLVSVRVDVPINSDGWEVYGELEGKTRGWVAGNEYLTGNIALRMGVSRVFNTKSRWKKAAAAASNN